jgi:hypothetical protein
MDTKFANIINPEDCIYTPSVYAIHTLDNCIVYGIHAHTRHEAILIFLDYCQVKNWVWIDQTQLVTQKIVNNN